MQSAKERAKRIVRQMPDNITMDQLIYKLYVEDRIERGLADEAAGDLIPHADVKKAVKRWRSKK